MNQSVLAEKITLEHAEAFCLAIKKAFELTDSAGELPKLNIPLTLWLNQQRLCKQPDLSQKWQAQSSHSVRLTYCEDTHYGILNNVQLHQSLAILLNALRESANQG
ncbi:hypothetical protein HZI31_02655 [Serratia fonticola]|uniref:hypothetical protein n=1 Tax=Serratia fonticola TaxID=47917 RepID=UPI0015C655D9|nr:hypothetical protein [Serratia fonticola]NYA42203.1 hypothetical protein [Serratia fonticola]